MGNFYTNFTVNTGDADAVAATLQRDGRQAFVLPSDGNHVVVLDAASEQDDEVVGHVGRLLSNAHGCPVLAVVNHDDDILRYWLFQNGQLTDSYNSAPNYFDETASEDRGGDAARLSEAFAKPSAREAVRAALDGDNFVFAFERHQALCAALGLPPSAVGTAYRDLERHGSVSGVPADQVRRVGGG